MYTIVDVQLGELATNKALELFDTFEEAYGKAIDDAAKEFDALVSYTEIGSEDLINYYNVIYDSRKVTVLKNDESFHERILLEVNPVKKS